MNKTNVDDVYIDMISKEAEKIADKFSDNGSLSSDQIHTLVLKTQYNHINHLDQKLDEVTKSVKDLEHKFDLSQVEIGNKFLDMQNKFSEMNLQNDKQFADMQNQFSEMNLQNDKRFSDMDAKNDKRFSDMDAKNDKRFSDMEHRFDKFEVSVKSEINQAIITQTKWFIGSAGVIIVLLKVLDRLL